MICSSECLLRFIVWSFLIDQTPIRPGSIQGGNVKLSRLRDDLRQAKQRADRAEQWLTVIHQQIEGRLLPSLNRDSSHRKDQKMKDNSSSTGK